MIETFFLCFLRGVVVMKNNMDVGNRLLVVKFGGSSLSNEEKIENAVSKVVKEVRKGTKIVVVVSAMGKTTDELIKFLDEASGGKAPPQDMDDLLSMGERTSARIFSAALKAHGVAACYLDPYDPDWPIITDDNFNNANPLLEESLERVRKVVTELFKKGFVPVIPGFIGKTKDGRVTTLGRGGSDTTAFIVAHALNADQVILVTDVEGIMTADPKLIGNAEKLDIIDVERLIGLTDTGKKFIHRKALRYKPPHIDVKIISNKSESLEAEGTVITGGTPREITTSLVEYPSMAVTIVGKGLSRSHNVLKSIFDLLERNKNNLLGLSINQESVILYLPKEKVEETLKGLHGIVLRESDALALAVSPELALIKIKGAYLSETPGVISAASGVLSSIGLNIYGLFTITSSIHIFVDWDSRFKALQSVEGSMKRLIEQSSY